MPGVFKRRKKGGGYVYSIWWVNEAGERKTKCADTSDKKTALAMANDYQTRAIKLREGQIDPREERYAVESRKPIAEHFADYRAALEAEENDGEYIKQTVNRARWIVDACKAERLADLTRSKIQGALGTLRKQGRSAATYNSYLRSINGFLNWASEDRRIRENPAKGMPLLNEAADQRRIRRELSADEIAQLLAVTENRTTPQHRFAGPDRAMLYRLALGTGFRAKELRSLTPESFDLDADPPTVTIQAGYSKNRKLALQPIHPNLAALLCTWLSDKPQRKRVFAAMPCCTSRMIAADMLAAREAWIQSGATDQEKVRRRKSDFLESTNEAGEVFDFHATRHTFISAIVNGGASVKVAQELARHSTPTLTLGRYTHTRLHDLKGALDTLPGGDANPRPQAAVLRATGTDGDQNPRSAGAAPAQQKVRDSSLSVATACDNDMGQDDPKSAPGSRRKVLKFKQDG